MFYAHLLLATISDNGFKKTDFGEIAFPSLDSAPYPHASRETGYVGASKTFPRDPHYTDSTVGIFIPSGFRPGKTVNFVVHFHGHNNHVSQVFSQFELEREMRDSHLNAVLIVPQGPRDAADSGDGRVQLDPHGLENLLGESLSYLKKSGKTPNGAALGKVALTAHSGGYLVTSAILAKKELTGNITDVILFDATYGGLDAMADWVKSDSNHRLISICTDHLGHNNAQLVALLQKRNVPTRVLMESDLTERDIARRGPLIILTTTLEHNDVVSKRQYFSSWLARCGF